MYKKVPCRYYDQEGRPSSHSCPQGNSCRFLHPDDPDWPRKMRSYKLQDGSRDSAPRTYRSTPLVPQSALFLRLKNEEPSRGGSHQYSDNDARDYSSVRHSESAGVRRKETERDSPPPRVRRFNFEKDLEISPKSLDNCKKLQRYSDTSRIQENKFELRSNLLPQGPQQFTKIAPASLFRDLARLSREVDDLNQVQRKEEENTKTYKKISATLESISESAATTIAPQLSRSLVAQADCKKVIEEKEKIIQRIWTDAVEAFVKDVKREIDVSLQAALDSIKQEARQVGCSVPGRSHKRQRDEDDAAHTEGREKIKKRDSNTSSEAIMREHKRRGTMDDSAGLRDDKGKPLGRISEMKSKVEQQAQMLALLAQENNELRLTLESSDK